MVEENVILEDVSIQYRNFSGNNDRFHPGKQGFSVFLPDEVSNELESIGWHVKHKQSRYGDQINQMDISFSYDHFAPLIKLHAADGTETILNRDTVSLLDNVDIQRADVEIRPYNWDVNGKQGTSAKVHELNVYAKPPRRSIRASLHRGLRDSEDDDLPF